MDPDSSMAKHSLVGGHIKPVSGHWADTLTVMSDRKPTVKRKRSIMSNDVKYVV